MICMSVRDAKSVYQAASCSATLHKLLLLGQQPLRKVQALEKMTGGLVWGAHAC